MNTIECPVSALSRTGPGNIAIVQGKNKLSYGELNIKIRRALQYLEKIGVKKGDIVVIVSRNSIEYIIILFALFRAGAVALPLNPGFPVDYITNITKRMRAGLLLFTGEWPFPRRIKVPAVPFGDVLDASEKISGDSGTSFDLKNDSTMILTSGSVDGPKGAFLTFGNHYYSALGSNENIPLNKEDKWLLTLPLFHIGGMAVLFRSFISGATVVIHDPDEKTGAEIVNYGITHISVIPLQLEEITDYFDKKSIIVPESLKTVLAGGSYISASLVKRALDLKLPVHTTYGMTEMSSQVTTTPGPVKYQGEINSGKLLKYRELKIGKNGEILVRGKTLFRGYAGDKRSIYGHAENRWFGTGDIGKLGPDGSLLVKGRRDNMFISGGENIHPEEIEEELLNIPGFEDALVINIDDEKYGKRPVAFIKVKNREKITKLKIENILRIKFPAFKIPVRFFVWPPVAGESIKASRVYFNKLFSDVERLEEIL